MKTYIVKNSNSLAMQGKAPNITFISTPRPYLSTGRTFPGKLVFVRTRKGFIPMIQVVGAVNNQIGSSGVITALNIYYTQNSVVLSKQKQPYNGLPRAGSIAAFATKDGRAFGMEAGEIQGHIDTAPQVGYMMSGADGYVGVQAGQIYKKPNLTVNPHQVEGGDIEGVTNETASHEYSDFKGVIAGSMHDWKLKNQIANPNRVSAGDIEGANTRPEAFSYADGFNRSFRYPNLRHYTRASILTQPESMEYPQYFDAENYANASGEREWMSAAIGISNVKCPPGCKQIDRYGTCKCPEAKTSSFKGVVAGSMNDWNLINQDPNPNQLIAGHIEGVNAGTEDFEYASGKTPIDDFSTEHLWYDDFSSANGEFWKNLFGKKELEKSISNKDNHSEAEMKQLHDASKSKKSFGDWLKSPEAAQLAQSTATIATLIWNQKQNDKVEEVKAQNNASNNNGYNNNNNLGSPKSALLNPLTIGIIGVVVVGGIIALVVFKGKGSTAKN